MTLIIDERSGERSFAEAIWCGRSIAAGSFISAAASYWELVVTDSGSAAPMVTIRGPETRPERLAYAEHGEWWGIRFPIGTHIDGLSLANLVNSSISMPVFANGTFTMCDSRFPVSDHTAADDLVHRLVTRGALVRDTEVQAAWLGATTTVPRRTLQRRFRIATGLSQQTARQIHRARTASDLLRRGTTILDTVAMLGYSDQAHLTRSLHRWMGQTPARVVQQHLAGTLA